MKAPRILETALYVRDIAEAVQFYSDILGLELVRESSERNAFFRCGDGILLLFKADETLKPALNADFAVPVHGTIWPGAYLFCCIG